jgi:hypothetical protein
MTDDGDIRRADRHAAREGVMAFLEERDPMWSSRVDRDWPDWPEGDGS